MEPKGEDNKEIEESKIGEKRRRDKKEDESVEEENKTKKEESCEDVEQKRKYGGKSFGVLTGD